MLELLESARHWDPLLRGEKVVAATVVAVSGSAPRPLGTTMLIAQGGELLGSLSSGCVEGTVVEAAQAVHSGSGALRQRFSYTDLDAMAVGLSCGGSIEVHLQLLNVAQMLAAYKNDAGAQALLVRRLEGGEHGLRSQLEFSDTVLLVGSAAELEQPEQKDRLAGLLGLPGNEPAGSETVGSPFPQVRARIQGIAASGATALFTVGEPGCPGDDVVLLVESRLPPPRLLLFGANDFGEAMIAQGKLLGYNVTLCDPRPAFIGQGRFSAADELVTMWPHRYLAREVERHRLDSRTVACVLGHDPKFDVPLIKAALALDLAFVGALGSRNSHAKRVSALLDEGVSPDRLAQLHSPIGLDMGASTPAEVALSIAAGIVADRNGKLGEAQLCNSTGSIHAASRPIKNASNSAENQAKHTLDLIKI